MTQPIGKPLDADEYASRHDAQVDAAAADFESVCLLARQQCNRRWLDRLQPRRVLEVGCGPLLLAPDWLAMQPADSRWAVVEPAARWAEVARGAAARDDRISVVQDYIENAAPALQTLAALRGSTPEVDLVLVSGVIHETAEPEALLRAALALLRPGGHLLVSVPNAGSFHRLLAVQIGLIPAANTLGERNRLLGQPVVYGAAELRALVLGPGLTETGFEGYLFKPFTHAQMAPLMPQLGEAGLQGLIELGRQFPEQAAEICLVARKP
ncbi:MAG TPA: methyltransferase domain-containing protein [Ideonella sp.]|uniref:class I SAM-dependent methyltransferase n=1 Tax=Ideonella sp. TaxID=1929293 RepID=UPI002CEC5085|nr:methyltransferase domain-containing protein [Ideonella sp.]HSI50727.1 methyltransferase domain-containing protein [Ideonella sp.]